MSVEGKRTTLSVDTASAKRSADRSIPAQAESQSVRSGVPQRNAKPARVPLSVPSVSLNPWEQPVQRTTREPTVKGSAEGGSDRERAALATTSEARAISVAPGAGSALSMNVVAKERQPDKSAQGKPLAIAGSGVGKPKTLSKEEQEKAERRERLRQERRNKRLREEGNGKQQLQQQREANEHVDHELKLSAAGVNAAPIALEVDSTRIQPTTAANEGEAQSFSNGAASASHTPSLAAPDHSTGELQTARSTAFPASSRPSTARIKLKPLEAPPALKLKQLSADDTGSEQSARSLESARLQAKPDTPIDRHAQVSVPTAQHSIVPNAERRNPSPVRGTVVATAALDERTHLKIARDQDAVSSATASTAATNESSFGAHTRTAERARTPQLATQPEAAEDEEQEEKEEKETIGTREAQAHEEAELRSKQERDRAEHEAELLRQAEQQRLEQENEAREQERRRRAEMAAAAEAKRREEAEQGALRLREEQEQQQREREKLERDERERARNVAQKLRQAEQQAASQRQQEQERMQLELASQHHSSVRVFTAAPPAARPATPLQPGARQPARVQRAWSPPQPVLAEPDASPRSDVLDAEPRAADPLPARIPRDRVALLSNPHSRPAVRLAAPPAIVDAAPARAVDDAFVDAAEPEFALPDAAVVSSTAHLADHERLSHADASPVAFYSAMTHATPPTSRLVAVNTESTSLSKPTQAGQVAAHLPSQQQQAPAQAGFERKGRGGVLVALDDDVAQGFAFGKKSSPARHVRRPSQLRAKPAAPAVVVHSRQSRSPSPEQTFAPTALSQLTDRKEKRRQEQQSDVQSVVTAHSSVSAFQEKKRQLAQARAPLPQPRQRREGLGWTQSNPSEPGYSELHRARLPPDTKTGTAQDQEAVAKPKQPAPHAQSEIDDEQPIAFVDGNGELQTFAPMQAEVEAVSAASARRQQQQRKQRLSLTGTDAERAKVKLTATRAKEIPDEARVHRQPKPRLQMPTDGERFSKPVAPPEGRRVPKPVASKRTNRKLIINAINFVCLEGRAVEQERMLVLDVLQHARGDHFVVLFKKGVSLKFKGLYALDLASGEATKLFGAPELPMVVTREMVESLYRYDSAGKQFVEVHAQSFSAAIDAVSLSPIKRG